MSAAARRDGADAVIRAWFSGREDVWAAVERIVGYHGPWWWAFALRRDGRPAGLGCEDGHDVVGHAIELGYRLVGAMSGSVGERAEIASGPDRVALLRALATLEETELDAVPGAGS